MWRPSKRALMWTILIAVGVILLMALVWDYVWINLIKSGGIETP